MAGKYFQEKETQTQEAVRDDQGADNKEEDADTTAEVDQNKKEENAAQLTSEEEEIPDMHSCFG